MKTVLLTGADRGLGLALAREYLARGYTVFAGRFLPEYALLDALHEAYPDRLFPVPLDVSDRQSILEARREVERHADHLDAFVSDAAYMGGPENSRIRGPEPIDLELLCKSVRVNALGALQCVDVFLPLLDRGREKRLCFISSEVSSVALMQRDGDFRYCMSKTALNIAVRMLHNTLYPRGYSFRLYQPGWMRRQNPDGSLLTRDARQIDPAFSAARAMPLFTGTRPDEERLELVDYLGSIWPF